MQIPSGASQENTEKVPTVINHDEKEMITEVENTVTRSFANIWQALCFVPLGKHFGIHAGQSHVELITY